MNYLSVQFAFFLAAALLGFHLTPVRRRALFLLLASYVFYALWSPVATLGIWSATVFAYWAGRALDPAADITADGRRRRRILVAAVGVLLAYLAIFKVMGPIREVLGDAAQHGWLLQMDWVLPLGISYYSFKLISYVLDVYWEKIPPARNFVEFAAYVAFFPQIVAGPIQRSGDFLEQIQNPVSSPEMMKRGLRRLLLGCFKKTVIADNLAVLIDQLYSTAPGGAHLSTLPAFYLFPLQLYADFSALTDIAIGIGLLFGIESPENFDSPFSASSISQYWRRWHMTLTTWLTDYVFLPLRMATRTAGNWGLAFSLMVNMLLIGLWHSVSWTFVVFGLLHGLFLTIDALTAKRRSKFFKKHPGWDQTGAWAGCIFTFHLVALAMVFVRAVTLPQALSVLARLFDSSRHWGPLFTTSEATAGLAGLGLWGVFEFLRNREWVGRSMAPVWSRWAFYYVVVALIVKYGHNAEGFIYFKF